MINQKTIDHISYLIFSLGPSTEKQMIALPTCCLNRVRPVSVIHVTEKLIQDSLPPSGHFLTRKWKRIW